MPDGVRRGFTVDQTLQIEPNGAPVTTTLIPGQKLLVTFQGIAGHRYVVSGQELTDSCFFWPLQLRGTDGQTVLAQTSTCGSPTLSAVTVSADGMYTIFADPWAESAGDVRITVTDTTGGAGLVFPRSMPEYAGTLAAIQHSVGARRTRNSSPTSSEVARVVSNGPAGISHRTLEWPPRERIAFDKRVASWLRLEGGVR